MDCEQAQNGLQHVNVDLEEDFVNFIVMDVHGSSFVHVELYVLAFNVSMKSSHVRVHEYANVAPYKVGSNVLDDEEIVFALVYQYFQRFEQRTSEIVFVCKSSAWNVVDDEILKELKLRLEILTVIMVYTTAFVSLVTTLE